MSQDFPFNPKAVGFNIGNAYSLAQVSSLVYHRFEDNEKIRNDVIDQANTWGFTAYYFFDYRSAGEDSQGMVLADADKIVIAFRGTELSQKQDVLVDLEVEQISRLNGRVHRGFYASFSTLWTAKLRIWKSKEEIAQKPGIKSILEGLLTEKKRPIMVTGHSLGAAMAVLAAAACGLELKDTFQPEISLYTYGQPRVGDDAFNKSLIANIKDMFRIVNNNDIVTRIPIDIIRKLPAIDYSHVGKEIYLDTNRKVHLKDLGWWEQGKDELWGRIEALGKPGTDGINDHDLGMYISILKGAVDNPTNIIA